MNTQERFEIINTLTYSIFIRIDRMIRECEISGVTAKQELRMLRNSVELLFHIVYFI